MTQKVLNTYSEDLSWKETNKQLIVNVVLKLGAYHLSYVSPREEITHVGGNSTVRRAHKAKQLSYRDKGGVYGSDKPGETSYGRIWQKKTSISLPNR